MATFKCSEFRPASGGTEARVNALEAAMVVLTRELGHVLSHLDGTNFTPEGRDQFVAELTERVKEAVDHGETS